MLSVCCLAKGQRCERMTLVSSWSLKASWLVLFLVCFVLNPPPLAGAKIFNRDVLAKHRVLGIQTHSRSVRRRQRPCSWGRPSRSSRLRKGGAGPIPARPPHSNGAEASAGGGRCAVRRGRGRGPGSASAPSRRPGRPAGVGAWGWWRAPRGVPEGAGSRGRSRNFRAQHYKPCLLKQELGPLWYTSFFFFSFPCDHSLFLSQRCAQSLQDLEADDLLLIFNDKLLAPDRSVERGGGTPTTALLHT